VPSPGIGLGVYRQLRCLFALLVIVVRGAGTERMASYSEVDPAATQYERLLSAMAELRTRGRVALVDAQAASARSAALYTEHRRQEDEWRARSAS
jgi:hypothetical protein